MKILRLICIIGIFAVFPGVTDGNIWIGDKDVGDKDGGDKDGIRADLQVDVKPGEDALLPCRAAGDADLGVAEWRRADKRRSLADILVIRDGKKLPDQHPSVHGRVKLKDPEMKSRDVSVILKNVTINDTGTHECRIKTDRTIGSPPELVNIIELRVKDSGQTEDSEDDGTKHEGPKNEGTEDEGLSDLTAVFKVFIILAGLAFVIVLVIRYSELFVAFWEIARRPAAALNSWRIFLFKLW